MNRSLNNIIKYSLLLFTLGIMMWPQDAMATHIVGGELSYECLGNNYYKIKLTFRRDCQLGLPEAEFDDPAHISVYDIYGNLQLIVGLQGRILMDFMGSDTLSGNLPSGCNVVGSPVCVQEAVYEKVVYMPFNKDGYLLVYQRCCRNASLANIIDPLETGTSLTTLITPSAQALCPSGLEFSPFPPIYVCNNSSLSIDQSVNNAQGDSIVYRLCAPNTGATLEEPLPTLATPPPYEKVTYVPGFGLDNLLGNTADPLTIDPNTGLLTGTPNLVGQYLVGICTERYRNGELLSRFIRDFELNVRLCEGGSDVSFEAPSINCEDSTIAFINTSPNADMFKWYFDFEGDTTLQSTEENPVFTYSDTGTYLVVLEGYNSMDTQICISRFEQYVTIANKGISANFNAEVVNCRDSITLVLTDLSSDTIGTPVEWFWEIVGANNSVTSTEQNPVISIVDPGPLTVFFNTTSSNGCSDDTSMVLDVDLADFDLAGDTVTSCPGEGVELVETFDPGFFYTWTPAEGLTPSPNVPNPVAIIDSSQTYYVEATDGICTFNDSIFVNVLPEPEGAIVDLSDSCEITHTLVAIKDSSSTVIWSLDQDFDPVLSTGDTFVIDIPFTQTIYARISNDSFQCDNDLSLEVMIDAVNIEAPSALTICEERETDITLVNLDPNDTLQIIWEDNPYIISSLDSLSITVLATEPAFTTLYYTITNDEGCILSDSIEIEFLPEPDAEIIDLSDSCDLTHVLVIIKDDESEVIWSLDPDFSDILSTEDTFLIEVPFTETVYAQVSNDSFLCVNDLSITIENDVVNVDAPDELTICEEMETEVIISNEDPDDVLDIIWEDNPVIISPLDQFTITIYSSEGQTTTLYYSITNQHGCTLEDSIVVTFEAGVDLSFTSDASCHSLTVNFDGTVASPVDVLWNFGDGNVSDELDPTHTYAGPGEYLVVFSTTEGCSNSDSMLINVSDIEFDLDDSIAACFSMITLNPGGNPTYVYEWSPENIFENQVNDPSPEITITDDVVITVIVTDTTNDAECTIYDTAQLFIPDSFELFIDEPDTIVVCEPAPFTISAVAGPGITIEWFDQNGNSLGSDNPLTVNPEQVEIVTLVGTDEFGCQLMDMLIIDADIIDIDIEVVGGDLVCIGDTAVVYITNNDPSIPVTVEWEDHPTILVVSGDTITVLPDETTTYTATVTNADGCSITASVTVTISDFTPGIQAVADPDTLFTPGESSQLDVLNGDIDWIYSWEPTGNLDDPNVKNPVATPDSTTTYTVTITNEDGCTATSSVTVVVLDLMCTEDFVFLPNAFSPNGDGENDVLRLRSLFVDEVYLIIYNRFGQKVFETRDINFQWPGTFEGEQLETQVFGYYLEVICLDQTQLITKGNITLLR